ncbi:MAG: type II toxin-antitoxin system Phd/YefM family antitoxin [Pseudomonadota bacterium]
MKTIPISRLRRGEWLAAATRDDVPVVVTHRGKPVARVLPFPGASARTEPAGEALKDRMDFWGTDSPPTEASWSGSR